MMTAASYSLDLQHISKVYRGGVHALRGISLQVNRGEIFGLLGPNGAGKSTLVKIIMTVVRPSRAEGTILGQKIGHKPTLARIGYLPENHRFPRYLTGRQTIEFFAAMSKVDRATARKRTRELLETVRMSEWADRKVSTYSKGMLQRIGLAQALVNDPELVLLDEPTDGVDPVGRREVLDVLGRLREQGKTVFINSHALSELETICDRVAILAKGQVAMQGTLEDLTFARAHYEIEVDMADSASDRLRITSAIAATWQAVDAPLPSGLAASALSDVLSVGALRPVSDRGRLPNNQWIELRGSALHVGTSNFGDIQGIVDALRTARFAIKRIEHVRTSLEDLFMEAITDPTTGHLATPGAARHAPKSERESL
ncbi:MAG TPA: ABC transporter ATP-binding protein [Humisphaera sp.]|jgi:ABC-2 type transport system ATP-binding protein|nr:ABC transporter ATP-binding protein [Humisphaera sp.]